MNTNPLEIRGLEKRYDKFHLGPIDVTVPKGAIYGFIGPNGAGKTTTIDLIFGMGEENAGSIRVLGFDHRRDEVAMKQRVGYVSPDLNYGAWGRVDRAIRFIRSFYPAWDDAYCARLMESFHLGPKEKVAELSFGARTKLAMVMALSWRPEFLILDEPLVGLDAISKHEVFSELLAAVREEQRTVLISSHDLADLERFADHVGMINKGRMLFEGETAEVVERYRVVDFVTSEAADFKNSKGLIVQARDRNRWRVLLDLSVTPLDWIKSRGGVEVAATPVTLEELFVALAKE